MKAPQWHKDWGRQTPRLETGEERYGSDPWTIGKILVSKIITIMQGNLTVFRFPGKKLFC